MEGCILLINPYLKPTDLRKEAHLPNEYKSERSINFGLLVIASYLKKRGYTVKIIDLEYTKNREKYLIKAIEEYSPLIAGIGNISSYSFLPSLEVARIIKDVDNNIVIVLGGQNAKFMFKEALSTGYIDFVVMGEGEKTMLDIIDFVNGDKKIVDIRGVAFKNFKNDIYITDPYPLIDINEDAFLEYKLYPNWDHFFPLVEESRGCPFSCDFCANKNMYRGVYRFKKVETLIEEIRRVSDIWKVNKIPVVLMCSSFGVNEKYTMSFLSEIKKISVQPLFLSAMRVDSKWGRYINSMSELFDQVHFGLESGSKEILMRIKKTTQPRKYLQKAEQAFKEFKDRGIHVAINFILGYIGETPKTLFETFTFITDNIGYIDSAWGGALIKYPGTPFGDKMDEYKKRYGASYHPVNDICRQINTYPVNPSYHFTFEQMATLSLILMKMINTENGYYEHYRWYFAPRKVDKELTFIGEEELFGFLDLTNIPELGVFIESSNYYAREVMESGRRNRPP